ncbi:MAG: protein-glutamate O-methyltransferase CheR [Chromatiales bacterium]|jgi:chemotaxis protein methyltransferase CheR
MSGTTLSAVDYTAFQVYLEKSCGIVLGERKEYLVTSRLANILRQYNIESYAALLTNLQRGTHSALKTAVIDAMTTNETFWFRDMAHFNILTQHIFPAFANKRMRIWSAACSSGQEPYSISMTVAKYKESRPSDLFDVDIIATDISQTILNEARKGYYCGLSASRGVDQASVKKYFTEVDSCIQVKPDITKRVSFREVNLTQSYSTLGNFDVIFCRNVLIYFSAEMKFDIINRLANALNPGGYLFLGSTEAPPGLKDFFEMRSISGGIVYQKPARK